MNFQASQFKPLTLPSTWVSRKHGCLHIFGGVGLGKTEWALSQFRRLLLVASGYPSRDTLRKFEVGVHNGIVLDKMLFKNWTVGDAEQLTEYYQNVQVEVRYSPAEIPKGNTENSRHEREGCVAVRSIRAAHRTPSCTARNQGQNVLVVDMLSVLFHGRLFCGKYIASDS